MRNLDLDSRTLENGVDRDPVLELIEALIEKGADVNARVKEFPPAAAVHDAARLAGVGGLHRPDAVPPRRALGRRAADAAAALEGRRPEHRHVQRHDGADGRGRRELGRRADLQRIAGDVLEAVQLCLELGADVNAVNSMGLAALHGAANRGSDDIIELLARRGARLDIKDKEGRTPLRGPKACSSPRTRRWRSRRRSRCSESCWRRSSSASGAR